MKLVCPKLFKSRNKQSGFTLIEILVVIGILAVLFAVVLIAINPARQFQQANDTKRASDVNAILNAIHQYAADNKGSLPAGIDTTVRTITNDAAVANSVDLCADLVTQYLAGLPVDPTSGTPSNGAPVTDCTSAYNTSYTVVSSSTDNRVTVSATGQITNPISVTR
ncbi:type II secretion system protein [Candidatus Gottesmanbacteria bacterium]|nr:type II secretion system protein [Candidatus Gottesmanbacteria bacterium]